MSDDENQLRKQQSERQITQWKLPLNPSLPPAILAERAKLREAREVARRVCVLIQIVAVANGQDAAETLDWLDGEGLATALSPDEIGFLEDDAPAEEDLDHASWQIEALLPLLWALGHVEELPLPERPCDAADFIAGLPRLGDRTRNFLRHALLRPQNEILDGIDLAYRLHWAATQPANRLNETIAAHRHWAFNWLLKRGPNWDEVPIKF